MRRETPSFVLAIRERVVTFGSRCRKFTKRRRMDGVVGQTGMDPRLTELWLGNKRLATACVARTTRVRRLLGCVRYTFCRFKGSRRFAGCGSLRRDARRPSPGMARPSSLSPFIPVYRPPSVRRLPTLDPDTARNPRHHTAQGRMFASDPASSPLLSPPYCYSLSVSSFTYTTLTVL